MTVGSDGPGSLKEQTAKAFAWSALQSWLSKGIALLLFFVLARYLTQHELGIAQSVMLMLMVVGLVSEQGLHAALLYARNLQPLDINVPFWVSVSIALLASLAMLVFSAEIAALLGDPGMGPLVQIASVVPPLVASTGILVVMLRRSMDFKTIATAGLFASVVSALASVSLAVHGKGALSIVVQAIVSSCTMAAVMWVKTAWRPSFQLKWDRSRELFTYSGAVFSSTSIEFAAQRLIEFIVLTRYGFAGLGVFAVGSKIYMAAVEVSSGALFDVSLRALSKLSEEMSRLGVAYLRIIFLGSTLICPAFIWLSAMAPEVCLFLFGSKWVGSDKVLTWFAILGAFQVMHFFNAAAMGAVGKPRFNLNYNIIKLIAGCLVLGFYPANSMGDLAFAFVLSQVIVAPYGYYLAASSVNIKWADILRGIAPATVGCIAGFISVLIIRSLAGQQLGTGLLSFFALSCSFFMVYGVVHISMSAGRLRLEMRYAVDSFPMLKRFAK